MNRSEPLISIIIPTYNRAELLKETLDSVISQTYKNWECLLIDDGSEESELNLIKSLTSGDKRFKFFERKNFINIKGANACRNIGLDHASGKYVVFFDSDDLFLSHCFNDRVRYYENNPDFDFIVFQSKTFSDQPNFVAGNLTKYKDNYLEAFLSHSLPWQTMGPLFKSSLFKDGLRFDLKMPRLQDPEFYTQILLRKDIRFKVLYDSDADSLYRQSVNKPNVTNAITGFYLYIKKYSQLNSTQIYNISLKKSLKDCYFQAWYYYVHFFKVSSTRDKKLIIKLTLFVYTKRIITLREFAWVMKEIFLKKL